MIIELSDVEPIEPAGCYICRVTLPHPIRHADGRADAGVYYPYVLHPDDPYGVAPILRDMIAKGETRRDLTPTPALPEPSPEPEE